MQTLIMEEKNIVKINHPYRHTTVNETEAWLKNQAENGLRLVDKKYSLFTFRKCKPYETEYFMYSSFNANAGIFHDYHVAKELYGKNGSEINKLFVDVFEVDFQRIDKQFYVYKKLRNDYYKKHYFHLSIFSSIFLLLSLFIFATTKAAFFVLVIWAIGCLYSIGSYFLLAHDIKKHWESK